MPNEPAFVVTAWEILAREGLGLLIRPSKYCIENVITFAPVIITKRGEQSKITIAMTLNGKGKPFVMPPGFQYVELQAVKTEVPDSLQSLLKSIEKT